MERKGQRKGKERKGKEKKGRTGKGRQGKRRAEVVPGGGVAVAGFVVLEVVFPR